MKKIITAAFVFLLLLGCQKRIKEIPDTSVLAQNGAQYVSSCSVPLFSMEEISLSWPTPQAGRYDYYIYDVVWIDETHFAVFLCWSQPSSEYPEEFISLLVYDTQQKACSTLLSLPRWEEDYFCQLRLSSDALRLFTNDRCYEFSLPDYTLHERLYDRPFASDEYVTLSSDGWYSLSAISQEEDLILKNIFTGESFLLYAKDEYVYPSDSVSFSPNGR